MAKKSKANNDTEITTHKEIFLAKIAGQNVTLPDPITHEEIFLKKIAENGGGGGGGPVEGADVKSTGATSGQVLTADGTGGADWSTPSGGTTVVANPTPAGTTPLTGLQVGNDKYTVFNGPVEGADVTSTGATSGQVLTADGTGGADWTSPSGGTTVVANPTPAGTTPLTGLQVGNNKYTISSGINLVNNYTLRIDYHIPEYGENAGEHFIYVLGTINNTYGWHLLYLCYEIYDEEMKIYVDNQAYPVGSGFIVINNVSFFVVYNSAGAITPGRKDYFIQTIDGGTWDGSQSTMNYLVGNADFECAMKF